MYSPDPMSDNSYLTVHIGRLGLVIVAPSWTEVEIWIKNKTMKQFKQSKQNSR